MPGDPNSRVQLQHVNVKLLAEPVAYADLEPLIPIFHEWIEHQAPGDLLLDIADYRHVPEGPVVALIGHDGDYSVDNTNSRLGVRYNRKAAFAGSDMDHLKQAARAALEACLRLESDPRLAGMLQFNGRDIEISFNDRLLTPNSHQTQIAADSVLREFCGTLFRGGKYSVTYESDRRRLFGAALRSEASFTVSELLKVIS
jgi:hypothetical protein